MLNAGTANCSAFRKCIKCVVTDTTPRSLFRDLPRIELNASLAAVEFYEKNGFFQVETVEIEMPSGRRLPGVQMRKQLQPEYLSGFC